MLQNIVLVKRNHFLKQDWFWLCFCNIFLHDKSKYVLCSYAKWSCGVFRDADDTKAWISEKDTALSTSDYGRDLASVQALQRKHEVLERDLAALEEKVR